MRLIIFTLFLTSINCFAQSPHSGLPSNVEQLIKDDYWSNSPTYTVKVRVTKEDSPEYQKALALSGYSFTTKREELIDIIDVNYKNTKNGFLSLLRLYKIRGQLDSSSQSCPIVKSDKKIAGELMWIPETGVLYSTIDESYLKNYHKRILTYCNKTLKKGIGLSLTSMFGLTSNYSKYLLDSKTGNVVINYPNF